MVALDRADIGEGILDVPGLHWPRIEQRLSAGRFFQDCDQAYQVLAPAVADVVERVRGNAAARFWCAVVEGR